MCAAVALACPVSNREMNNESRRISFNKTYFHLPPGLSHSPLQKKKKLHCVLINPCRFGPKVKEIFSRFTFRTQRKLHLTRCSGRPRSWDWVSNPITCVTSLVIHLIFSIPLQKTPTGLHSRSREHFCFSLFFFFFFFSSSHL